MKRKALARHVTLGALVTGLVPLTAAGAGAGPAGGSAAALCRSTFGERGPAGGRIVGEGPSGDPMSVTIGWDPADWSDGLREIVTCVSVDGRAVPALTTATATPPNSGSLAVNLTLPPGEPGSVVCEQSVLVGSGAADGHDRPTSPVCFKLRAADPPPPTRTGGRTSEGSPTPAPNAPAPPPHNAPAPPAPVPSGQPGPPARSPHPAGPNPKAGSPAPRPKAGSSAPRPAPAPDPASTPPARAAFEAAASAPAASGPSATRVSAPPAATPKDGPATVPANRAPASALPATAAGARPTALARTGIDHHLPLAGGGGLLALGGAAIVFGEPRRRTGLRRA